MSLLQFFGITQPDCLNLGAPVPNVVATGNNGTKQNLAEWLGEDWALVYFFPKSDTPGCTKQACSLRDAWSALADAGVRVFGVSPDSVSDQRAFSEKQHLPFPLIADEEGKIAGAFGVPTFAGMPKRQTFLFHKGKLVWRDLSASTSNQAVDVLHAIEQL